MKVAVTGAAGLLGRFVVAAVRERHDVVPLDLVPGDAPETVLVDVLDPDALGQAMADCEAVIHLAALDQVRAAPEEAFLRTNVVGTWNVFMVAERVGVRRAVLCSSVAALGLSRSAPPVGLPIPVSHPLRPTSAYGLSKQAAESVAAGFARRGRMEVVCLRPALVTFPHHVAGWAAAAKAADGLAASDVAATPESLPLTGAYVGPEDAGRAFACALDAPVDGFTLVYVTAVDTLSRRPTLDVLAERFGSRAPVTRPALFDREPSASPFDLTPADTMLGWRPRDTWADTVARHARL